MVAKTLVDSRGKIPIRMINPTDSTVVLPAGTAMAILSPVTEIVDTGCREDPDPHLLSSDVEGHDGFTLTSGKDAESGTTNSSGKDNDNVVYEYGENAHGTSVNRVGIVGEQTPGAASCHSVDTTKRMMQGTLAGGSGRTAPTPVSLDLPAAGTGIVEEQMLGAASCLSVGVTKCDPHETLMRREACETCETQGALASDSGRIAPDPVCT